MSRRGENIRKRSDGRWEGRFKVETDEKCTYHSVYAKTYGEVKVKLASAKMYGPEKREKRSGGSRKMVLRRIAKEWLEEIKSSRKCSTYQKYRNTYYNYIDEPLGEELLYRIDGALVYRNLPVGFSESVYKTIYGILNQILSYGARRYQIPVTRLERNASSVRTAPVEILTPSEQARLLRILYDGMDSYKLGILICLSTGLRLGEICALKWTDIDMDLKLLYVNCTVQRLSVEEGKGRLKTRLVESVPKSACSKREIPMSDQLYELLLNFNNSEKYLVNGNSPMEPRTYQYKFKSILKEAEIGEKKFHVLRHTFATNCISNGADVKCISEILGHADIKITLNRYVHPTIEAKRRHLDSLFSVYGQFMGRIEENKKLM